MTRETLARDNFAGHGDVSLNRRSFDGRLELELEAVGCTMRVPFGEISWDDHCVWLQHRDRAQCLVDAAEIHAPDGDPLRNWIQEEVAPVVEAERR